MNNRQAFGRWGETYAAKFLAANDYLILARNYRTPYGEIDLVAQRSERLIFVEVKTRSSTQFGYPEDALTPQKRQHLFRAALAYLQSENWPGDWQLDVIAILKLPHQPAQLTHFENIAY